MRVSFVSILLGYTATSLASAGSSSVEDISNSFRGAEIGDELDFEDTLIDWEVWRTKYNITESHFDRHLTEDLVRENDICINFRRKVVPCNKDKFPKCKPGIELCYNRVQSRLNYYDQEKKFPRYYIDYKMIKCAPEIGWNCDRCDNPAIFCRKHGKHGICMDRPTYVENCEDKSASKIRAKQRKRSRRRRKEQRDKRKAARKKREQTRARAEQKRTNNQRNGNNGRNGNGRNGTGRNGNNRRNGN